MSGGGSLDALHVSQPCRNRPNEPLGARPAPSCYAPSPHVWRVPSRLSSSGATVKVLRAAILDAKLGKAELARQGEWREHGMMPCPDVRGVRWSSCRYPDG